MNVYYNELDPKAAAWLRALIAERLIPDGPVDERDIRDIVPTDLSGFRQCHFFAGIGGWAYALRLAGWPDDRPVWTGSCPCQPFSQAGCGEGLADERHLWPAFFHLIEQCCPPVVLGEQVASKAALEQWFDGLVAPDLEGIGYAVAAADLPAAGVGAPHIRQRLYWVADAGGQRCEGQRLFLQPGRPHEAMPEATGGGGTRRLADTSSARLEVVRIEPARQERAPLERGGEVGGMADAAEPRRCGRAGRSGGEDGWPSPEPRRLRDPDRPHPDHGVWAADWLGCRDGTFRPVEPGTFPLAHGTPARVGRLRGYGNAIVPQVAAEFVMAWMDVR